jgi:hypothetical protein
VADVQRIHDGLPAGTVRLATDGQINALRNRRRS